MKLLFAVLVGLTTFAFFACSKNSEPTRLEIRMTDAPLAVDEVNVELEEVRVKLEKDTNSWVTLQTNAGTYNLLDLQGGVSTVVAAGTFTSTENVKEIRLILGDDNNVVVNGTTYPLTIPSGAESGLKIKVGKDLRAPFETILIDFDAALSIKQEQDGYKLRPVVKLK